MKLFPAQEQNAATKTLQSCPTLCNPIDRPTRLLSPGILQARILEWAAISFSKNKMRHLLI